jgi:hypothetical protein
MPRSVSSVCAPAMQGARAMTAARIYSSFSQRATPPPDEPARAIAGYAPVALPGVLQTIQTTADIFAEEGSLKYGP